MIKITQQQAARRWDTLPDDLREFMFAENTTNILDKIFADLNIPENKQPIIRRIAGHVLMGFIHSEDMAKELQEATEMNSQHARELADSINIKIFSPFRGVLEKIYALPEEDAPIRVRPSFDSVVAPKVAPIAENAPRLLEALSPAPAAPVPATPAKTTPATPAFTAPPAVLPSLPATPSKPASASTPAPISTPAPKPAPAPFMIQTETKAMPITQAPKFTMESLGKTVSAFGGKASASMAPPKAAQVEIGNLPEKTAVRPPAGGGVVGKYESSPRTIHYGGPSTPLPGSPAPSPSGPASPAGGPVSFGALQRMPSAPKSSLTPNIPAPAAPSSVPPLPKPSVPPSLKPATPLPSGAGGFIKTLITPKNEAFAPSIPPPPPALK